MYDVPILFYFSGPDFQLEDHIDVNSNSKKSLTPSPQKKSPVVKKVVSVETQCHSVSLESCDASTQLDSSILGCVGQ